MADSEKLPALKKAHAEIILNTAKEVVSKIMVSETKAVPCKDLVLLLIDFFQRVLIAMILICSSQYVKKMRTRSKLPVTSIEGEGTVISSDSA